MDDFPFFSIVMPVYNSDKYLDKAILSILQQTYYSFELIIVDDCSTDESLNICKKYINEDKRIKLVKTEKNDGVANARNLGIKCVKGKYCTFIDSDDWVECDLLECIFNILKKNPVDIVKYSVVEEYIVDDLCIGKKEFILREDLYDNLEMKEVVPQMWADSLFSYLCNGFYNVSNTRLRKWCFDTSVLAGEDILVNLYAFDKAESLYTTSYCGYHYAKRRMYSLSTMMSSYDYLRDYGSCIKKLKCYCGNWGVLLERNKMIINWIYLKFYYQTLYRNIIIDKRDASELRKKLRGEYYDVIYEKGISQCKIKNYLVDLLFRADSDVVDNMFAYLLVFMDKKCKVILSKIKG